MDYKCKQDAEGWELYSHLDGAPEAAKALSAALTAKIRNALHCHAFPSKGTKVRLAREVRAAMRAEMETHGDLGACDTEPEFVLVEEIREAFGLDYVDFNRWN